MLLLHLARIVAGARETQDPLIAEPKHAMVPAARLHGADRQVRQLRKLSGHEPPSQSRIQCCLHRSPNPADEGGSDPLGNLV
jgi:hypothetical protein